MHRKQAWSKRVKKERQKKKYLTRMQATRLLQVDSIHFRRLCILKGIYPRALNRSKQKQSGNDKQYYLAREIKWLVRDHLADRMMAFRAWEKKVRRAEAMRLTEDLKVLHSNKVKPKYSLVATIKERYPYFADAVRDIDDAMSMIALYAFLSPEVASESTIETHHTLTSGLHRRARETCERWNSYVERAQALSKGFISIKGYYFEAIVRGERVRWLCPHEYAHKFPAGVQQYIMISFLEFYLELMRFVLFKLERDLAEKQKAEEEEPNLNAENFDTTNKETVQGLGGTVGQVAKRVELMDEELRKVRRVFEGLSFYISREVPHKHAALVIKACGGRVATGYVAENITHFVVDRPALPPGFEKDDRIEYVQPQYLFDCLNARLLLPPNGYRIGEELPPHVSPFTVAITNSTEDIAAVEEARRDHPKIVSYVPKRVHEIRKLINPQYTPTDPDGKAAELLLEEESDEENVAAQELDRDDDVQLSGDELQEARRRPKWEDEQVTESVERTKLSALKVRQQRELNLMNAPTNEAVARRRLAQQKAKEARKQQETDEHRLRRKLADVKRQEVATRKMQLQVARKKAARYYKMVNGVVQGNERREKMLTAKAKQLSEGRISAAKDGSGLVNNKLEARRAKAEAAGKKLKKKKPSNPYSKLPKWVR
ncbi:Pescadillo N-terminus/BRCA1 C Terminus (BRCT) domain containing protein [Trypanosoma brucei equiperdum]|uniref:Pescadillo homolog n=1 Tax=Trypanosoma brucei equiperdum TaxID=630700 RepID=A0A3L6L6S7_9TRYP|nr:Pescadillo N-terminus/BRCA1 C Terminus (BRCT) domain containing protein [Trypanosoma brucei equiperdum]